MGLHKNLYNFSNNYLSSKVKDLIIFKLNLSQIQNRINSNKLFESLSSLELFKITLSIQIQTRAINKGLLKMSPKKISRLNSNLFERRNQPRAHK
jgi:hypothetical protein